MDTKRLVRAYVTLPVAGLLGAAVGALAGAMFGAAMGVFAGAPCDCHGVWGACKLASTSAAERWPGPWLEIARSVAHGAEDGARVGCLCGAIGRAIGGIVGWAIGGFWAGVSLGCLMGPGTGAIGAFVGPAVGVMIGLAIGRGRSRVPLFGRVARYLHNWDHLAGVASVASRAEARELRARLRAQGVPAVVTGGDLHALALLFGRRRPIRVHVPEQHAEAAALVLSMAGAATELEAASPPAGLGTELESGAAPWGGGGELIAGPSRPPAPEPGEDP